MRPLGVVVFGAVLVVVGCGSPDAGSASLENGSTGAEPTATLPGVEATGAQGGSNPDAQELLPANLGLVAEAVIPRGERPFVVVSPTQIL